MIENLIEETLIAYKNRQPYILECIRIYLKQENYQKSFISRINKLLCVSSSRLDGLQLVKDFNNEISADALLEHGCFWLKSCLNNHEYSENKELHLQTIKSIIESSMRHSEFGRQLAAEYLTPIINISLIDDADLYIKKASIECLTACLKYFSNYAKQHKKKLEEYLLSFLESPSENLIAESAIAFIYCQNIPCTGNISASCTNSLSLNFKRLCVTCHYCFNEIFEDLEIFESEKFEVETIDPFILKNHKNKTQIVLNLLKWLTSFINEESCLKLSFEFWSLFERGLAVHKCIYEDSFEKKYKSVDLRTIQTEILQLLTTVASVKNISPLYSMISEIMGDLAKKKCSCYSSHIPFQKYFFEVLQYLLSSSGLEKSLQNTLVSRIIKNNTPLENHCTIKMHANMVGKSSKTKQNLILNSIKTKTNETGNNSSWTRTQSEVSIISLKGLLLLMESTLDEDVLYKVTSFLIDNILLVQKGKEKPPFNNELSRELLYRMLSLVLKQEKTNICRKYREQIKRILEDGTKNKNFKIFSSCEEGLKDMEKIFELPIDIRHAQLNNFSGEIGCSEHILTSDILFEENEIKILENNVLVPANMETQTNNDHGEVSPKTSGEEIENNEQDIELPDRILTGNVVQNNSDLSEEPITPKNGYLLIDESSKMNEIDADPDLQIEPVAKRRKTGENVEDLFTNEFNDDYE